MSDDERVNIPFGGHVLNLDASDSGLSCNSFRIINSSILDFVLLHLFMHDGLGFLDDLLQEHDCTLSGAHAMNKAKVHVFETVCPRELQEFKNFEELCRVKILCRGDDVDHLIELILFVSLYGAGDVTSEVDRSAVYD